MIKHEQIEKSVGLLIVLTLLTVIWGGLLEIVPLFFQKSTTTPIEGVKPYDAVRLVGRDIYVREGCFLCHSQMIRPFRAETERYGHYSVAGEFVYDHPFQWGSRRIGPDLAREGGAQSVLWHTRHFRDPKETSPDSIMPAYPSFEQTEMNFHTIPERVQAHNFLAGGNAYSSAELANAEMLAREQAKKIASDIIQQNGGQGSLPKNLENTQLVALVAYLQRLGVEQSDAPVTPPPAKTDSKPVITTSK